jgi:hypothetical protein
LLNSKTAASRYEYIARLCRSKNKIAAKVKLNDLKHNMNISRIENPTEKDFERVERYRKEYEQIHNLIMQRENNKNEPRPTIVFGDIHGLTYWKKAVEENPDCRYIFLGDYLDPYGYIAPAQLIDNLKEIIQLKKDRRDDVVLLLGNHDLHYFCPQMEESCRYVYEIGEEARTLFEKNRDLFLYAFQDGKRIFTHAGISEKWFLDDFYGDINKNIAEQLNNPERDQLPALYRCGAMRGGDYFATGGIFWADINELDDPLQGFTQIVGHNRVDDITDLSIGDGRIIFCDCLYYKKYLKL